MQDMRLTCQEYPQHRMGGTRIEAGDPQDPMGGTQRGRIGSTRIATGSRPVMPMNLVDACPSDWHKSANS